MLNKFDWQTPYYYKGESIMIKLKIFTCMILLVLVGSFISINPINADTDQGLSALKDGIISPDYVVYCPYNANGLGKHMDMDGYSTMYKSMVNGEITNGREWFCSCGAIVYTTDDIGNYHFYQSDAVQRWMGNPVIPFSYQYWDVFNLRYGNPIDWQLPNNI